MNYLTGYQTIYDNGEAYENTTYANNTVYLSKKEAVKEIQYLGYTEKTREEVYYDGETEVVDIYRLPAKDREDDIYDNEQMYVRKVGIVERPVGTLSIQEKLTQVGYQFKNISHPTLDVLEVQVPFLNHIHDYLLFYITSEKGEENYTITDDGYTLNELELAGIDVADYQDFMKRLMNPFGIQISKDNEIILKATKYELIDKLHLITQVVLQIYALVELQVN